MDGRAPRAHPGGAYRHHTPSNPAHAALAAAERGADLEARRDRLRAEAVALLKGGDLRGAADLALAAYELSALARGRHDAATLPECLLLAKAYTRPVRYIAIERSQKNTLEH